MRAGIQFYWYCKWWANCLKVILFINSPLPPLVWILSLLWSKFPQASCFENVDSKCAAFYLAFLLPWVFSWSSVCDISLWKLVLILYDIRRMTSLPEECSLELREWFSTGPAFLCRNHTQWPLLFWTPCLALTTYTHKKIVLKLKPSLCLSLD